LSSQVAQALSEQLALQAWKPRPSNAEGLGDLLARQQSLGHRALHYRHSQMPRIRRLEWELSICEEEARGPLEEALDSIVL
jgi:hypothetical protein